MQLKADAIEGVGRKKGGDTNLSEHCWKATLFACRLTFSEECESFRWNNFGGGAPRIFSEESSARNSALTLRERLICLCTFRHKAVSTNKTLVILAEAPQMNSISPDLRVIHIVFSQILNTFLEFVSIGII